MFRYVFKNNGLNGILRLVVYSMNESAFLMPGEPQTSIAAVVKVSPANGTIEWKLANGKTYKEWEADKLAQEGVSDY